MSLASSEAEPGDMKMELVTCASGRLVKGTEMALRCWVQVDACRDGALFWFASSPLSPGKHPWPVIGGVLCHLQIAHLEAFLALPSNQLGYGHCCGLCIVPGAPGTVLNKGNTWNRS